MNQWFAYNSWLAMRVFARMMDLCLSCVDTLCVHSSCGLRHIAKVESQLFFSKATLYSNFCKVSHAKFYCNP